MCWLVDESEVLKEFFLLLQFGAKEGMVLTAEIQSMRVPNGLACICAGYSIGVRCMKEQL